MRRALALLCLALLVLPSAHALEREQKLKLPMTDGMALATDVYLPAEGEGPWPTILMRSTYGRDLVAKHMIGSEWVRPNYAFIIQDIRGTFFNSRDKDMFYADGWRDDLHDGRDTVDWITAQPWSDGKVGVTGESGIGMPASLIGPSTPKVTAQFIVKSPPSFYHHAMFHGGVLRENLVMGWLTAMGRGDMIGNWASRPCYDEYWKPYDTIAQVAQEPAAGFFVGSWYDIFQQGIIDAFTAREYAPDSASRGRNYLVMKPDTHNAPMTKDYKFQSRNEPVADNAYQLQHRFFDAALRGDTHAMDGVPKVQFFVLGADTPADAPGNEWRSADAWPPYETREAQFLLDAEHGLREGGPAPAGSLAFAADPGNPYPTWGGALLSFDPPPGALDQRRYTAARTDYLAFATAPLDNPVEVIGRVRVRLYVSTDAPDTDFTAKLVDVYPDGREINILDGIRRLKYRDSDERAQPYTPGEVVPLDIDLWTTSIIFAPGHRIAVHIAGSNYPRFSVNPNTGAERLAKGEPTAVAHNTVHFSEAYASALVLPLHEH